MYTKLGENRLKSGELLEVGLLTAPDAELADAVKRLLEHKDGVWAVHIAGAFAGETDDLETRFYLGLVGGAVVANVMTVESHGIGILGHVFTLPEQRKKGICRTIMQRAMEEFRARGGRVLTLSTGFESPPYWIYHGVGFRSMRRGFMRFDADPDRPPDAAWFAPADARVVPLEWRHWPLLAFLGAQETGELLRSAAWRLFGRGNLERPAAATLVAQGEGHGVRGVVLEADSGAVVGCATVHPTSGVNGWPEVWIVDVLSHPNYAPMSDALLGALVLPSGKMLAYVDLSSEAKAAALERHGFALEGTLSRFLQIGDQAHDVLLYGRSTG